MPPQRKALPRELRALIHQLCDAQPTLSEIQVERAIRMAYRNFYGHPLREEDVELAWAPRRARW